MPKKRRRRKGLDVMAEEFAAYLLYEASSGRVGKGKAIEPETENPISFKDRRALLDSVTKLLGAQRDPEDGEEDGISSFREHLRGGDSGEIDSGADSDDADSEA